MNVDVMREVGECQTNAFVLRVIQKVPTDPIGETEGIQRLGRQKCR